MIRSDQPESLALPQLLKLQRAEKAILDGATIAQAAKKIGWSRRHLTRIRAKAKKMVLKGIVSCPDDEA